MGGRVTQYVEAHAPGGAVVPRRQSTPFAPLLAVRVAAIEGAHGGDSHTGIRIGTGTSPIVTSATRSAIIFKQVQTLLSLGDFRWLEYMPSNCVSHGILFSFV